MSTPFLLAGVDCEGDTRDFGHSSLASAVEDGFRMSLPDGSGEEWQGWSVWGNDPVTEEWRVLVQSNHPHFL